MVITEAGGFPEMGGGDGEAWRKISAEKNFSAGTEIFRAGDPGDGLYWIRTGQVDVLPPADPAGNRQPLSRLGPGDFFGEMAVIEDRPRSASAVAATDTATYFFPRDPMRDLLQRSPRSSFRLLQIISLRLRDFNQRHLQELVAAERLAFTGRFAQSIVHDLKNPLSIIGLCAELFTLPGVSDEMRAQAPARIRRQVERINDLVGDLLIFTEAGPRATPRQPMNFSDFILPLVKDLQSELELKSIELVLPETPPSVPVLLDPRRLSRVFHNLVHNATEAMSNAGRIFLRFQTGDDQLVVEIEDTGPGLATEIAGQLFQPFATHGKAHGTGLGLSICRKIVEDHGGRIWSRQEPRRGAIFAFSLPIAK